MFAQALMDRGIDGHLEDPVTLIDWAGEQVFARSHPAYPGIAVDLGTAEGRMLQLDEFAQRWADLASQGYDDPVGDIRLIYWMARERVAAQMGTTHELAQDPYVGREAAELSRISRDPALAAARRWAEVQIGVRARETPGSSFSATPPANLVPGASTLLPGAHGVNGQASQPPRLGSPANGVTDLASRQNAEQAELVRETYESGRDGRKRDPAADDIRIAEVAHQRVAEHEGTAPGQADDSAVRAELGRLHAHRAAPLVSGQLQAQMRTQPPAGAGQSLTRESRARSNSGPSINPNGQGRSRSR